MVIPNNYQSYLDFEFFSKLAGEQNKIPKNQKDGWEKTDGRRTIGKGRWKRLDLLRKKDLHEKLGIPKSTVADWLLEFNVYIPKLKQGRVTYYKRETLEVLQFIRECREKNYDKPQIFQLLADKGFPITVEEAVQDVKKVIEGSPRDSLLTIMQTIGQAVNKVAEQDEQISATKKIIEYQQERIEVLERRMEEMDEIRTGLERVRQEIASAKEKKSFFGRFFRK